MNYDQLETCLGQLIIAGKHARRTARVVLPTMIVGWREVADVVSVPGILSGKRPLNSLGAALTILDDYIVADWVAGEAKDFGPWTHCQLREKLELAIDAGAFDESCAPWARKEVSTWHPELEVRLPTLYHAAGDHLLRLARQ